MKSLCSTLSRKTPHCVNPLFALNSEWDLAQERVRSYVFEKVLSKGCIREGTRVYHGSMTPNLDLSRLDSSRITFFGLEPVICMWYTLEESEKRGTLGVSYIYEYRVEEPIAIDRYIAEIKEHPEQETCVHPQVALHGYDNYHALMGPFDLSIEVTLKHVDRSKLCLVKVYRVDTKMLSGYTARHINELKVVVERGEIRFERKGK